MVFLKMKLIQQYNPLCSEPSHINRKFWFGIIKVTLARTIVGNKGVLTPDSQDKEFL